MSDESVKGGGGGGTFYTPRSLLIQLYGSRIVLVISGLLVGLLLALPVELRLISGHRPTVADELIMSAFALFMAMLVGAFGGVFQPCRFAEWGWITDLQMVERPASEMLRAIRRASYRWMLPHMAAVLAVRIGFVLLQLITPEHFQFSAFIERLQNPVSGHPSMYPQTLVDALMTLISWMMLLAIPFAFEVTFWASAALLFHRADQRRAAGGDLAGSLADFGAAGTGGLLGILGLILGIVTTTLIYFISAILLSISMLLIYVVASAHPLVAALSAKHPRLIAVVITFSLVLAIVPVFYLAQLWILNSSLYKIDDVWNNRSEDQNSKNL